VPEVKSRREEYAEATRSALVAAAEELFAGQGYAATSIEDVVRRARVTRGALYHHFRSKQELFEAVLERIETDIVARITAAIEQAEGDHWQRSLAGMQAYLDLCMEPGIGEISLRQAPAALGWKRWREIEERHALGLIRANLEILMADGLIRQGPVDVLARIVFAALTEAALLITAAADPAPARRQAAESLIALLSGLTVDDR
jgi:AcrR family transcriptional regulator